MTRQSFPFHRVLWHRPHRMRGSLESLFAYLGVEVQFEAVSASGGQRSGSLQLPLLSPWSVPSLSLGRTGSALTMIVSSLRPTRRPLANANVLQALLRELAMEWQLECGRQCGRITERGGDSRLSCSSPHNKTTLRSASSFPFSYSHNFTAPFVPSVHTPSHPHSHSLSSSAGRFSRAKLRWSAIGRWRSRKHKCTLTLRFHSGQSR